MPVYEYFCKKCQELVEINKKIVDCNNIEKCEACGEEMSKLISPSSFLLKGGGWAKDGYCPSSGSKKGGG